MPVKLRVPKERIPQFSTEILELFRALNATPRQRRRSQQFKAGERKLASLLGFETETAWWNGSFCVVTCSRRNPFQPWLVGYDYWFRCRVLRAQLLEATGLTKKSPAKARRGAKADDEDAQPSHKGASHATPRVN
jgi:hypothetical protein